MIQPTEFIDQLCDRIEKVLTPSWWEAGEFPDEEYHTPVVHAQYLPTSKTGSEQRDKTKDCPVVLVVITSGTMNDFLSSVVKIQIYFTIWRNDTDNQGWRIAIGMLWAVLQNLLEDRVIGAYQLTTPIEWTPLNTREPPYYTAQLDTVWMGGPPAVSVPGMENNFIGTESEEKFESLEVN